jgi:hypothetical protein
VLQTKEMNYDKLYLENNVETARRIPNPSIKEQKNLGSFE